MTAGSGFVPVVDDHVVNRLLLSRGLEQTLNAGSLFDKLTARQASPVTPRS
jgi:hypothetical protein